MGMQLTVSEETQYFVECLIKLDDAWSSFYKAIEYSYGESQTNKICDKYQEIFNNLRKVMEDSCMESINDNLSRIKLRGLTI